MDRRKFLINSGRAAFGVASWGFIPDIFMSKAPVAPTFFKLSLAQWSLHRALETKVLPPLEFPKVAASMGFDGVEYVSSFYSADVKASVKELKTRTDDLGIQNVLIMVDGEGELAALEKSERDMAVENHQKWIDAAALLGCHSIRVNLFGRGAENDFALWKQASVDGLGRLSEIAQKSRINVIVENHGGLSSDAAKLVEVIKSVNMKNCGTLPDFGNFCVKRESGERWAGACIQEYDRYKGVAQMLPYAKGVSAKSYDFDADGNETTIDYGRMISLVKKSGYSGFIGVEYEGTRLDEMEGIRKTVALIRASEREK